MKSAIIVFPGSNSERDAAVALEAVTGEKSQMVWHGETALPDCDLIVLPGGFAHGDYLRAGAMAARSPIMADVIAKANAGTPVLGICNGFQILIEAGLLPGALLRNAELKFVCRLTTLRIENTSSRFTRGLEKGDYLRAVVANGEGNYFADAETLDRLEGEGRVAFRYVDNPNGSIRDIAGVVNEAGNVLGLMPHPERVLPQAHLSNDCERFFRSVLEAAA